MSNETWDIDYDLKAWAEWSRHQSGNRTGYPTIQPFTRMLPNNIGYVPDNYIDDDYAMVVDVVVANLNPLNNDLFLVVQLYYLWGKDQRYTAKALNWSVAKLKQKLSVARDVIKAMIHILQVKAANDDKFNSGGKL